MFSGRWALLKAVSGGTWRDHPGRLVLAVLGIALGVALGVAVHLINASAVSEFDLAVRSLAGEADLVIRGPRSGFSEALYARIARRPEVRAASPAVEIEVQLPGRSETIKILGLDPFRAAQVQPHLLAGSREAVFELLKPDAVLISRAAADHLGLKAGDLLRMQIGVDTIAFRIAALLPAGATRQRLAVMDVANAQWRFGWLGQLHRIDVKLAPGTTTAAFQKAIEREIPPGVLIAAPQAEAERGASLSRAYRTNLDMLALVTLFTGAFLVFSTQFLAITRRRAQLALLRVLGLTRARLFRWIVLEGAVIGVCGSALGVVIGCALAQFGVERLGGDLGAGYFGTVTPGLSFDSGVLFIFFVLGVAFAITGAALPALGAARRAPALALKAGDEEAVLQRLTGWPGLLFIASGLALSQAPATDGLPLWGYLSIAFLLTGAILVMPRLAEFVLSRLPLLRYPPAALASAQLQATPRQVGVSLAAILASFSLMVSMLVMVGSFRDSLATWLDGMLPADLYVRAGSLGVTGYFTPREQTLIKNIAGVRDATFIRTQNVFLRSDRPPVALLARPLAPGKSHPALPFEGATRLVTSRGPPPAWLSEVAADLLGVTTGALIEIPIANTKHTFIVAGIWRDYARQNGAIAIERTRYVALTGDERANEAAVYLDPSAATDEVSTRLRAAFGNAEGLEIASTRELKRSSLAIFDRTFAVTYVLEIAAVVIGLFGVSASFSAQALARRREFGVLRHIGMTRREIAAMLGCEGLVVGGLGVLVGLALGWVISLILIHVINRQSFHWSMDMYLPWQALALLAAALVIAAGVTAVLSARRAMTGDVTRAVREDW
ncbi:MAG: h16 [Betaproteobacteria bacterium]|nr:h16 [Betaproteobacteria bacterium]